jgi:radical SAM protein with 4Fe4S-binding SPASM domain
MYVQPFWSYRTAEAVVHITNWISETRFSTSVQLLNLLEDIHAGRLVDYRHPQLSTQLERARKENILFSSELEADLWLRAKQLATTRKLPVIDQIELTNRCPYTCKMCPRTLAMDRPLGFMSLDLFRRIITQVAGNQSYVGLHHFGESLLHKELPEAVAIALEAGIKSGISCNPPSLNPVIGTRLLDVGLANILFSFDSLNTETYRSIRGQAANFEKGDEYLREFIRRRDEGHYDTFCTLQMIYMYSNHQEADRFLQYCAEVGVDRGLVIRLGRWDFSDPVVNSLGESDSPGFRGYCDYPTTSVVVLWDGRVVPCCHDYNGEVVFGDLKHESLAEIWNAPKAVDFRQNHRDQVLCQKCAYSRFFREQQRHREGFQRFHKERGDSANRREWLNPSNGKRSDGRLLHNRFDIVSA